MNAAWRGCARLVLTWRFVSPAAPPPAVTEVSQRRSRVRIQPISNAPRGGEKHLEWRDVAAYFMTPAFAMTFPVSQLINAASSNSMLLDAGTVGRLFADRHSDNVWLPTIPPNALVKK